MSQDAMIAAQLSAAQNELEQNRAVIKSLSGQTSAQKQALEEFLNANVMLRSSCMLLEQDLHILQEQIKSLSERIIALEKDKSDLLANENLDAA